MTDRDQTADELAVMAHKMLQSMTAASAATQQLRRSLADGEPCAHEDLLDVVIDNAQQVIDTVRDLRSRRLPDIDLTAADTSDRVHRT